MHETSKQRNYLLIRCYSCDSKENKCSEFEFGSKIDCPASTGCRIAKKNDLEDPMYVRDCAIEEDFFCDTFDNPDGEEGVRQNEIQCSNAFFQAKF